MNYVVHYIFHNLVKALLQLMMEIIKEVILCQLGDKPDDKVGKPIFQIKVLCKRRRF